eukprot:CAMPEP_0194109956 /NCGR_PEP_ID=MMETSP0150-20130528/9329_1 /TAXON_ID=122233 /ORGANISM="Chaetoceros debilis, Strain MM31A-1" /LENGTH=157 /DNA_ID=CAMNT_0038799017 /DNA_START=739 /DNA_END=1212 /DNA_ORIENTATION=+
MTFFVEKDDDDHHHDPDDHDSDDHDDDDDDDYNLKYHIDEKMRDRRKFIVQAVNDLWEINPTRSIAVAARNKSNSTSASASSSASGPDPDPDPENGFSHEPGSEPGSGSGSTRDKAKYHEEYVHGWKETEERVCKVVLIGRNLDRDSLEKGFRSCFI